MRIWATESTTRIPFLHGRKIYQYKETGEILPVTVSGIVNKGVIALVEGVRGFIPVSRLDLNHVEDTNVWLGRDIRVRVIEADMEKGKLVLSAREILREESAAAKKAQREMAISKIETGSVVEGTVESIQSYGAFIDLGNERERTGAYFSDFGAPYQFSKGSVGGWTESSCKGHQKSGWKNQPEH